MGKTVQKQQFVGIDVSGESLQVALEGTDGSIRDLVFKNDAAGHKALVSVLTKGGCNARVCLESTGNFSLDVSLVLVKHARIELMVLNPKAARHFAKAQMRRAKTDKVDARSLLDFLKSMAFTSWTAPASELLTLRAITRRAAALTVIRTAEENRLAAARATAETPTVVLEDIEASIAAQTVRIEALLDAALAHVGEYPELAKALAVLTTLKGIGKRSGVVLVAELLLLPKDMSPREVVAHCGLDPRPKQSGTRDSPRSISKIGNSVVRGALYMPALTAVRWEPAVRRFHEAMTARNKLGMVSIVAVMRKLLQSLWRMLLTNEAWDGSRFGGKSAASA